MKPVTISTLKNELNQFSEQELIEICLKLAKYKIENKELLTYLLFDSNDEGEFVRAIKEEIDVAFSKLNQDTLYFVKKSTRKTLRSIKKYIRYSKNKESEASILLHFCLNWKQLKPGHKRSQQMINMYEQQLKMAKKAISSLHEDLQYDFNRELEELAE
jgi:hypothetical protein